MGGSAGGLFLWGLDSFGDWGVASTLCVPRAWEGGAWGRGPVGGGAGGARGTNTPALSTGRLRDPILWLVALPSHGSALLALVALVGVASDPAASRREHSE